MPGVAWTGDEKARIHPLRFIYDDIQWFRPYSLASGDIRIPDDEGKLNCEDLRSISRPFHK